MKKTKKNTNAHVLQNKPCEEVHVVSGVKNHKEKNNSSCKIFSVAEHIILQDIPDAEKKLMALEHPSFIGFTKVYKDQRRVIFFNDQSMLAYNDDGVFLVDKLARKINSRVFPMHKKFKSNVRNGEYCHE